MRKLFNKISVKEQSKLLKLLETSVLIYKKDTAILSSIEEKYNTSTNELSDCT